MAELIAIYSPALTASVVLAALILLQLLVADVVAIKSKHVPGTTVPQDHSNFLFRTTRTVANTNETLGLFLLLFACALLLGATAAWVNTLVPVYVVARIGYSVCYYAGWGIARSTVFTISLIALAGLLLACAVKLF